MLLDSRNALENMPKFTSRVQSVRADFDTMLRSIQNRLKARVDDLPFFLSDFASSVVAGILREKEETSPISAESSI